MTQQEILNIPNLKIAEVKPNMFLHVHAADGFYITTYKDGDDIKSYSASICMYMPIRDTYAGDYRTITETEHKTLEERALAAIENERNKRIGE